MPHRFLVVCLAFLIAQCAAAQCPDPDNPDVAPTITSLAPSSGRIYPALYGPYKSSSYQGTTTCTYASPCTLAQMIPPFFTTPSAPDPEYMVWYGTNFCGTTGIEGPVWWTSYGNIACPNCNGGEEYTDLPWAGYGVPFEPQLVDGIVEVYLGGYVGPDVIPNITPAEFGTNMNPLNGVNMGVENYNYHIMRGNSLPFNLIGPYKMVVQSDLWEYCKGCATTIERLTTYRVVNSDGSSASNIPIGESAGYSTWTCDQKKPIFGTNSCTLAQGDEVGGFESLGMSATNDNGLFTDGWTLASDGYTKPGCGFKAAFDDWQVCGIAVAVNTNTGDYSYPNYGLAFATLTGNVQTNSVGITIGGKSYVIGPENCGPDMPYPTCPFAIPSGTVIVPDLSDQELRRESMRLN